MVNNFSLMISCSSLPSVASFGDPSEADVVPEAVESLKEQEEECRRRTELELDEIKLEETLEYQRRIENEAKEKHIAEQQKKYSSLVTTSDAEAVHDICRDGVVVDLDLREQEKSLSQVTIEWQGCGVASDHLNLIFGFLGFTRRTLFKGMDYLMTWK